MSGLTIEAYEWNKSILHQAKRFENGAVAAELMAPVWLKISTDMFNTQKKIFSSQGRRGGGMWKPLADSTVYKKGHSTILVDTKDLMRSLTVPKATYQILNIDNDGIEFGTSRPWAFVHQYGDRRGHVPRRQFLKFTQVDYVRWQDMLLRHLMRPFNTNAS